MKKLLLSLMALLCTLAVSAQEEIIWSGDPAGQYDGCKGNVDHVKSFNFEPGDILRVYLTNMNIQQKVYIRFNGVAGNSPDVFEPGTLFFDHVLTKENINYIMNIDNCNTNSYYSNGGFYVKFATANQGQVYKVSLRKKGTPDNCFALREGSSVAGNLILTDKADYLTLQAAKASVGDKLVIKVSGAVAGNKVYIDNKSYASLGLSGTDMFTVDADGNGELSAILTADAAAEISANGLILQRASNNNYSFTSVYLYKAAEIPETPGESEIRLWEGTAEGTANATPNKNDVINAEIAALDTVKVYLTDVKAGDKIWLKEAGGNWDSLEKTLVKDQKVVEFCISPTFAKKFAEKGLSVQRTNSTPEGYKIYYVTVAKRDLSNVPAVETLANEETYIQWDGSVCVIPKSQLSNLTVGDKLHVYINHWYTSASTKDNKIEDPNKTTARLAIHRRPGTTGHDYITANSVYMINSLPNNEFVLEFTQEVYNKMFKDNGDMWDLAVSGYWYSFSKVTLEHPNVTVTEIIEERSTPANSYGTICLPYDATAEGAAIFKLAGKNAEATGLVFEYATGNSDEESTTLEAGVPYLYRATADAQTFTCDMTSTTTEAKTINGFMGTYSKIERISGYFLNTADDMFHPAADYVNVGAYKCYIPSLDAVEVYTPSAARQAVVFGIFGSEATGVTSLNTSNVSSSSKYIQNGQIVVVKNGQKYNTAGQLLK